MWLPKQATRGDNLCDWDCLTVGVISNYNFLFLKLSLALKRHTGKVLQKHTEEGYFFTFGLA